MSFWGFEVKPGNPFIHSCKNAKLRITQATLGIGNGIEKSLVQCNVGRSSPVFLCVLLPNEAESCHLCLEFDEEDDVIFSVIGPRSVHLAGYYVYQNHPSYPHSDTESYGIDIENTEIEKSSQHTEDDMYEDSFIDDSELPDLAHSPLSRRRGKKLKDKKDRRKQLKKKHPVIDSDDDPKLIESDDEDGYLLSVFKKKKAVKTRVIEEEGTAEGKVGIGEKLEDGSNDGFELKEKDCEQGRKEKLQRHATSRCDEFFPETEDQGKDIPQKMEPLEGEVANKEDAILACETLKDKALQTDFKLDLSIDNIMDQIQDQHSPEISDNPKRKRKDQSEEDKMVVVENANYSVVGAEKMHTSHTMPDLIQPKPSINVDSAVISDSLSNDSQHKKRTSKKKKSKSQGDGNLGIRLCDLAENEENALMNDPEDVNEMALEVKTLSDGLAMEELAKGDPNGKVAVPGRKVKIHFIAMLKENGYIFESSVGQPPCKFRLGDERIIDGFNVGIDGMRVGDKRRLVIPPSMGFGDQGYGVHVPPNSWLVYDVELVGVRC